jgi:hypothetical protein
MQAKRDNLMLIIAFAAAVTLHAVMLPWVGAAVGEDSSHQIDLRVESFQSPAFARAGEVISVTAVVGKQSDAGRVVGVRMDRTDLLALSRTTEYLNDEDSSSRNIYFPDDEGSNQWSTTRNPTFDLPNNADGPYWLIFNADAYGDIPDSDRTNNTRVAPIFIDGPQRPELAVELFDAPERVVAGGAMRIDFAVENVGEGWASSSPQLGEHGWADRIYLSTDDRLDATDVPLREIERVAPLGPGQGYRHEGIEVAVPRGASGPMHLIFAADADQLLDQPSFVRGFASRAVTVIDTNRPDLVVATITSPNRLVIGRTAPLSFTIANLGSASASGDWLDAVYLSRDGVLDEGDLMLADSASASPLASRSRYDAAVEVKLPEDDARIEPGDWYVIVKADSADAVDEAVFEENNTFAVPIEVWTQARADAEIRLGDPDRPERLVVQWIENERVEEHIARRSRTVQPALQSQAEPDPNASLVDDPQPPAIASTDRATGDPNRPTETIDPTDPQTDQPPPDATATDVAPRPQTESSPTQSRVDGLPGETGDLPPNRPGIEGPATPSLTIDPTPGTQDTPTPTPGERDVPSPADPTAPDTDTRTDSQTPSETESDTDSDNPEETKTTEPSEQPEPDPTTTPKPDTQASPKPDGSDGDPATPSEEQTPTRAPKDDSEAPPTDIKITELKLQEGRVLVGKGIKVTTKLPTPPGVGSRVLSIPRNARVRITFDNKGKVYRAEMIRSTTYKEWDAAIEASLYRWSATGEAIEKARPHVTIEWDYLLNDLFDDDD